jgi:hypothetical protein
MHRFFGLIKFFISIFCDSFRRAYWEGIYSGWVFLRVNLLNFYIHHRNKSDSKRVECPCCGWQGHDFIADDIITFWLPSVYCPNCRSHERQRMLYIYIHRKDQSFFELEGTVLHFSPEEDARKLIEKNKNLIYLPTGYNLHDIIKRCGLGIGFVSDIQDISLKDESVDIIFNLHVLEHVRYDRKAIQELNRILKPGGYAYIMVPFDMNIEESIEFAEPNPDCFDHIWAYALPDFKFKLDCFDYVEIKPDTYLTPEEQKRYRIPDKEVIYRCTKR